jgi:ribose 5-phosphate isomerase A
MTPKQRAGEEAVRFIQSGMTVGIGTGSTADFFIVALANAIKTGKLRDIRGVPTSIQSERRCNELGIPLTPLVFGSVDVTVDGADEIDAGLNLIKGLGGALLREKLVAQNSKQLVIIADSAKAVNQLGTKGPLPVEVTQFAHEAHQAFLRSLGGEPSLRMAGNKPYVTDNGNYIYDCKFRGGIANPALLEAALGARAGIVETGLFLGIASDALIADDSDVQHRVRP